MFAHLCVDEYKMDPIHTATDAAGRVIFTACPSLTDMALLLVGGVAHVP